MRVPVMFTEDKFTRGKRVVFEARTLYDHEAVRFARKGRLQKLPNDNEAEKTALVVVDVQHPGETKRPSVYMLKLRHEHGGFMVVPQFSQGWSVLDPPEFWEVLYCLLSDISGIEDETFESWCGNFDYDTDSRQAEKSFNQCRDTLPRVRRLLGKDFDEIRALDEDDLKARFQNVKTFRGWL